MAPTKPKLLIYRPGPPLTFLDTYDTHGCEWTGDPVAAFAMTAGYVKMRLPKIQLRYPDAKSIEVTAARVLARRRMV